jgi:hypothetical protein
MKAIISLLIILFCQTAFAQAHIPANLEKRVVRIAQMDVGEHVQAYADAMIVDDSGNCWLNPRYIAAPMEKGDIEIIHNKLGYIVRVNYHNFKTETGYSVPRWPSWKRGYVPPGSIPVKGISVDKPYQQAQVKTTYEPRFTIPKIPPNPYSWEKENVRSNSRSNSRTGTNPGASRNDTGPKPGPDFILPELFK